MPERIPILSTLIIWLVALPLFMVANRFRGGGWPHLSDPLPGRALFYVSPVLGLLTWAGFGDRDFAIMTGIGFLIWGAPGWGLWFDLHEDDAKQKDDPRRDTAFVKFIDAISFGSDHVAMFWRHGLFVAPYLAVVAWAYAAPVVTLFAPVFAVLGVLAYALKKLSGLGNRHSEFAIGAFWWALVLAVFLSASG